MKSSNNGIRLIQEFEGLRLTSYLCSAGVPTIGYGATYYHDGSKVKLGQTITREQAAQLLKDHLKEFEGSVIGLLNNTKVNQNQFDALVSFMSRRSYQRSYRSYHQCSSKLTRSNLWIALSSCTKSG